MGSCCSRCRRRQVPEYKVSEFKGNLPGYVTEVGSLEPDGSVSWTSNRNEEFGPEFWRGWNEGALAGAERSDDALAAACFVSERMWRNYSDREEEFVPPSTARQRRQRGITTTSLTEEELETMANDTSRPRRAEHCAAELARRRERESREPFGPQWGSRW